MDDATRDAAIEYLRRGEALPLSMRDVLFPSAKSECELCYADKVQEERVIAETMPVPLQPTGTFGEDIEGPWANMLIAGDNLQVLRELIKWKQEGRLVNSDGTPGIRLVYIDPPFGTQKDFSGPSGQVAYSDKIAGAHFVEFIRQRLILLKMVMAEDASIYVHLDEKKSHYIKIVMDEIFGEASFQREIVWRIGWISGFKSKAKNWARNHDSILFYTKSPSNFVFNKIYVPYSDQYKRRDGAQTEGEGYPLEDTWNASEHDKLPSIQIMSFAGEKTGYPTQKNENLLERIITSSSDPGDIVLDVFCGSGTTPAVAEKLGRRWVAVDSSKYAHYTTLKRMLNLRKNIGNTGKALLPTKFRSYNAGLYDYATLSKLPWKEWLFFALSLFNCTNEPHKIGGVSLHGRRQGYSVLVHDYTKGELVSENTIADLHRILHRKIGAKFFIVAPRKSFDFQQDYVPIGDTRYYALRIPYSFINELHARRFTALDQPTTPDDINNLISSVGFDFNVPPNTDWSIFVEEGEILIRLVRFDSQMNAHSGFDGLSMVMIYLDYSEDSSPTAIMLRSEFEAIEYTYRCPEQDVNTIMAVAIDTHGNESKVLMSLTTQAKKRSEKKAVRKRAKSK